MNLFFNWMYLYVYYVILIIVVCYKNIVIKENLFL